MHQLTRQDFCNLMDYHQLQRISYDKFNLVEVITWARNDDLRDYGQEKKGGGNGDGVH